MQCSANDTNYQDDVRYMENEGALGEAVCQAQGLTKPKKSFSASGGGKASGKFQRLNNNLGTRCFSEGCAQALSDENPSQWYKEYIFWAFFCARPRAMRTAMQSQNLKVTTYTSFFRQCKSKIKPWGGY